jgi:hypothetical protein
VGVVEHRGYVIIEWCGFGGTTKWAVYNKDKLGQDIIAFYLNVMVILHEGWEYGYEMWMKVWSVGGLCGVDIMCMQLLSMFSACGVTR